MKTITLALFAAALLIGGGSISNAYNPVAQPEAKKTAAAAQLDDPLPQCPFLPNCTGSTGN